VELAGRALSVDVKKDGLECFVMLLNAPAGARMAAAWSLDSAHASQGTEEKTVPVAQHLKDVSMDSVRVQESVSAWKVGLAGCVINPSAGQDAKEDAELLEVVSVEWDTREKIAMSVLLILVVSMGDVSSRGSVIARKDGQVVFVTCPRGQKDGDAASVLHSAHSSA